MPIKSFTPTGLRISSSPSTNIIGVGTETTLFTDVIAANSLVEGKFYPIRMDLSITTPAINLTNITFKVKYGSSTINIINSASLVSGLTNAPVTIQVYLVGRSPTTQFITISIVQPTGGVISLGFSNSSMRSTTTIDSTVDQTFSITAQLTGVGVASTSISTDWILRNDY